MEGWLGGELVVGTLLGPEETGDCFFAGQSPHVPYGCGGLVVRPCFENCIVNASIFICGQVFKGTRWMPWHQEPMKDVGACDMPRGVGNQTLIRGFPNGET
jgi:hypothetical protein